MNARDNPFKPCNVSAERLFLAANEVFLRATVADPRRALQICGAVKAIFGPAAEALLQSETAWDDQIVADDRPVLSEAMLRAVDGDSYEIRYRVLRAGEETTLVERGIFLQGEEGLELQALIRDASEGERLRRAVEHQREALEDALADSDETYMELQVANERLREAQRIAGLGHWEWDLVRERFVWSDEMFDIWGLDPDSGVPDRERYYATIPPSDAEMVRRKGAASVATGDRFEVEHRVVRPDGDVRWVYGTGKILLDRNSRPVRIVGTAQDVTERRHLEEQLRHSQKMEAVGRLAGGVAHDFNNILTAIFSFTEFALEGMHPADASYSDLQEVLKAAYAAKDLTSQLLAFSRRRTVAPRVLNVNRVVTNVERMLRRVLSEDVNYQTILGADLWATRVDPAALEQVIVNLALNARDAMPLGGTLTVETCNVELDATAGAARGEVVEPGEYVVIMMTDTGRGMDLDTQRQIFEPFFTTKDAGQGTGLGLSTCYGIVKQAGGYLWVYSEVGNGSTFKIYLPRTREKMDSLEIPRDPGTQARGEMILVVEDDEQVRALTVRALAAKGYRTLAAANGQEALRILREFGESIDLLLTDVIMPEMSGAELAKKALALQPDLRVLFMSGYTEHHIVTRGVLHEGVRLLQKPFAPDRLSAAIRDVLTEPAATKLF